VGSDRSKRAVIEVIKVTQLIGSVEETGLDSAVKSLRQNGLLFIPLSPLFELAFDPLGADAVTISTQA